MIKNNTDKTLVLEWMGQRKELGAHWSMELDPESESYLLLKYPELSSDSTKNVILDLIKSKTKVKETKPKLVKKTKSKK